MKKLIAIATVVAFCFMTSPTISAQSETATASIETPEKKKSLKELESDFLKAEKKLTSLEKEMKYIETIKGNKKYKKEVKANYELARLTFMNAETAYHEGQSVSTFKALELPPADATAEKEDEE